jgi:hypothetical protein
MIRLAEPAERPRRERAILVLVKALATCSRVGEPFAIPPFLPFRLGERPSEDLDVCGV